MKIADGHSSRHSTSMALKIYAPNQLSVLSTSCPPIAMNTPPVTKETEFPVPARRIIGRTSRKRTQSENRRFRAIFGTAVRVFVMLWERIGRKGPPGARQEHLLWALLFLKTYGTEHVNSMICPVDEKHSGNGAGNLQSFFQNCLSHVFIFSCCS